MSIINLARRHGFKVSARSALESAQPMPEDTHVIKLDKEHADLCEAKCNTAIRAHFGQTHGQNSVDIYWDFQADANIISMIIDGASNEDGREPYFSLGFHGFYWEGVDPISCDEGENYTNIPVEIGVQLCNSNDCKERLNDVDEIAKGYIKSLDDLPDWLAKNIVPVFKKCLDHRRKFH
jgi:hypothetical protein